VDNSTSQGFGHIVNPFSLSLLFTSHPNRQRTASHTPFLTQLYKHSPVNTSPPFIPPIEVSALEQDAKEKTEDLKKTTEDLQKVKYVFC
jgi:hypothetical protein